MKKSANKSTESQEAMEIDSFKEGSHEGCKFSEKFNLLFVELQNNGGARLIDNIVKDEAGMFLLDLCEQMPHAPLPQTLLGLCAISIEKINEEPAIVYSFNYAPNSMCQNVFIFLVRIKDEKIRFFAVETDLSAFVLCEYSGSSHFNYGRVDLKEIPTRIKEELNT